MIRCCLLALLGLVLGPVVACELEGAERKELQQGMTLFHRVKSPPLELAQHFAMQFRVCRQGVPVTVSRFKLDAVMPAHNHGMNYRASIVIGAGGLIEASGLMFHMPGRWQLLVDFASEDAIQQVKLDYQI